ncbi:MAG: hypothetical protein LBQ79_05950 [Deltaproteobacteria bacterium]|jgi:restriction endonuclease Mrr|nr:hypothetical protein [Deltaproteobacteria bacterium]
MAFPPYEDFILPVLELTAKNQSVRNPDLQKPVARHMKLSKESAAEILNSGRQTRLGSMIRWALLDLLAAGLLRRPAMGLYEITPEGRRELGKGHTKITRAYLSRYPSFLEKHPEFARRKGTVKPPSEIQSGRKGSPAKISSSPCSADRPIRPTGGTASPEYDPGSATMNIGAGTGWSRSGGSRTVSTEELINALALVTADLPQATFQTLRAPALAALAARRKDNGAPPPDLDAPGLDARIRSAMASLARAGRLERVSRGTYSITEKGLRVLGRVPGRGTGSVSEASPTGGTPCPETGRGHRGVMRPGGDGGGGREPSGRPVPSLRSGTEGTSVPPGSRSGTGGEVSDKSLESACRELEEVAVRETEKLILALDPDGFARLAEAIPRNVWCAEEAGHVEVRTLTAAEAHEGLDWLKIFSADMERKGAEFWVLLISGDFLPEETDVIGSLPGNVTVHNAAALASIMHFNGVGMSVLGVMELKALDEQFFKDL